MAGRYKAYPEYKDSGIEWLAKIPSHWFSTQIKYGFDITLGKMLTKEPKNNSYQLKPYLKAVNIQSSGVDVSNVDKMWFSPSELSSLRLEKDDLLISEGGDVGRSAIWGEELSECYIQNAINRARALKGNSSKFLFYWMHSLKHSDFIDIICNKATIAHYTAEKVEASPLFLPSPEEQQKIANFLDHETAKIDTLITKQEKLIELLKEKRQAVISHAVTKGLNPKVPMKDSGVEWLGEVPEHWAVSKLKWKAQTTSGGTPSTSKYEVYYEGGDIPWIRTTDLNNGKLFATPVSITAKALEDTACSILPKYSVLLAMYGGAGSIGKHSLLMFEAAINQAVCGIYPSSSFEPEFLHYFYEFYRPFWMINAAGTRKDPNIGQDHIKEAKIALPPKEEQRAIVAYVNKTLDLLNKLNDKAIEAIELAKERKTALISAAVTGKIDVRDWQPKGVQG